MDSHLLGIFYKGLIEEGGRDPTQHFVESYVKVPWEEVQDLITDLNNTELQSKIDWKGERTNRHNSCCGTRTHSSEPASSNLKTFSICGPRGEGVGCEHPPVCPKIDIHARNFISKGRLANGANTRGRE